MEEAYITRVHLKDFRNHQKIDIDPSTKVTVLVGPNAAGKTNILEAIALVTRGTSFRTLSWPDVVREGAREATVAVEGKRSGTAVDLGLTVDSAGKRAHRVNGARKRRLTEVYGRLATVTFVPDDLQLAKGPPETRRGAIDILGSQLSEAYATLRAEYSRTVRHRNALLKRGCSLDESEVWTERLIETGAAFFVHRTRLAERLARHVSPLYEHLAPGEHLSMLVDCSWEDGPRDPASFRTKGRDDIRASMERALRKMERVERQRGMTLVGPHRDDVVFTIQGRAARSFASQGQQRSLALAWKMAEVEVVGEVSGYRPILLLDDVMSELDERRRCALQGFIASGPQTLLTTTNLAYFGDTTFADARVIEVGAHG